MKTKLTSSFWFALTLFSLVGQIAWVVENMYLNVFIYKMFHASAADISAMVAASAVTATLTTVFIGAFSDKIGKRKIFICGGYILWGVSILCFILLKEELIHAMFPMAVSAASIGVTLVIVLDCVMTFFGSSANDAAFNAWVTDNTESSYRGRVESVLSILPLIALLIVAGGFGILKDLIGFRNLFIGLGAVITVCGVTGLFLFKDAPSLEKNGGLKDILYGFRPSVIKENAPFYVTLLSVAVFGIAFQVFMPYLIIFMSQYLGFSTLEYSAVFAVAILAGAGVNIYLGKLSDRMEKSKLLYFASGILFVGLLTMYLASMIENKIALILLFGFGGFVMICGNIFSGALNGSILRDHTPSGSAGKMQGVRMVASVLIPMLVGPAIGNAINRSRGILLENPGADAMTTEYLPAPEIFLVGAIASLLVLAVVPFIRKAEKR
jgi:MFS family permease